MRVGQGRQAGLADQVGLGRADRRDVQLVAADDGDPDPDRAVRRPCRAARAARAGGSGACWPTRSPSRCRPGSRPTRRSSTRPGSSRRRAGSPPGRGPTRSSRSRSGRGGPSSGRSRRSTARRRRPCRANSAERSGSAMTPSFICRRTAKSGSLVAVGAGMRRWTARNAEARPGFVRDARPEIGWQVRAVYAAGPGAGTSRPDRRLSRGPARIGRRPRSGGPTITRSSRAPNPAGVAAKAARSSGPRSRSSWATIGASASAITAKPSIRITRQAPAAAGTRSATSCSNVAIARDRRSSSSRPRPRAASGSRSPSRTIGRRRPLTARRRGRRPERPARRPRRVPGRCRASRSTGGRRRRRRPGRPPRPSPPATRAGSRSSRVVVVTKAWGSVGDPPDEVRSPVGIELREDVVEQEQRRAAVLGGQQVELGELEGEDRGPLLAARREPRHVAAVEAEDEVVAVRADERRAVPDLLVGRLGEAPGEGVPRRLAGECRRVRRVRDRQPGRARPRPGRSRRGPGPAARQGPRAGAAARRRSPRRRRGTTRPRSGARRGRPAPRGSPGGGCSAAGASGRTSARSRPYAAERCVASWSSAARRRPGEPTTRSISSGAKTTVRSSPTSPAARRATPLTRIRFRAPPPAAGRPDERDLDGLGRRPAPRSGPARCPSGRARRRSRSGGSGPRRAGRSPRGGSSCRRRSARRSAAARARRPPRATHTSGGPGSRSDRSVASAPRQPTSGGLAQEVVRSGITTWT